MNKRQAKKDRYKRMLDYYRWKDNRDLRKAMQRFDTYYKFYLNERTFPMRLDF